MKCIYAGGEKLGDVSPPPGVRFFESYGPTECLANITASPLTEGRPVGKFESVFVNTKVYILDAEHRRLPFGAVGELFI